MSAIINRSDWRIAAIRNSWRLEAVRLLGYRQSKWLALQWIRATWLLPSRGTFLGEASRRTVVRTFRGLTRGGTFSERIASATCRRWWFWRQVFLCWRVWLEWATWCFSLARGGCCFPFIVLDENRHVPKGTPAESTFIILSSVLSTFPYNGRSGRFHHG